MRAGRSDADFEDFEKAGFHVAATQLRCYAGASGTKSSPPGGVLSLFGTKGWGELLFFQNGIEVREHFRRIPLLRTHQLANNFAAAADDVSFGD